MVRLSPWNILDLENGIKINKTEVKPRLKHGSARAKATHWGANSPFKKVKYVSRVLVRKPQEGRDAAPGLAYLSLR